MSYVFEIGSFQKPLPGKLNRLGEDVLYTRQDCISVFDGVGSWADDGIDAREYSSKLADGVKEAVEEKGMKDALQIMNYAYENAKTVTGTSTGVIVILDQQSLHAANLGDSQFLVIRQSQVILESTEQQLKFNRPYQMGTGCDITPLTHADVYSLSIQNDDVIIMGTDGLFDNLFPKNMVNIVKKASNPLEMAKELAKQASLNSKKINIMSPFAKLAKKHHVKWSGGKPDDITVIVLPLFQRDDFSKLPHH